MDRVRNKREAITRGSIKEYFRNDLLDFWVPFEAQGAALNVMEMSINQISNTANTAAICRATFGTGARFGTTTQIESYGTSKLNYEYNQPFSCIAWAVHDAGVDDYGQIIAHGQASAPYRGWFFWKWNSGGSHTLSVDLISDASPNDFYSRVNGSTPLNDGLLHCLGMSYDGTGVGSGVHLYVDGRPETLTIAHDTLNSHTIVASVQATVGNRDTPATNNQGWNGNIEEAGVIKRSLSVTEHALYYEWAKPRYV